MTAEGVLTVVGCALLVLGAVLCAIAAVGVVRLPDVLLRLNAVTKASSLGVVCVLLGVALVDFSVGALVTMLVASAFLLVTAPVAGHVVGHAVYRSDAPLWSGTRRDDLSDGDQDMTDDAPSS
jgi:multicomponent Na+:H+ antiporter subunit G